MRKFKISYSIFLFLPFTIFFDGDLAKLTFVIGLFFISRLVNFVLMFGKSILIRELIEMIFILQTLFAPALYYCLKEYKLIQWQFWYWPMKVPYEDYFSLAIPAAILFIVGLYVLSGFKKVEVDFYVNAEKFKREENSSIGFVLVGVGIVANSILFIVPVSLGFVITLFTSFQYIGFIYIYYSFNPFRKVYLGIIFAYIVINGLARGMLGDLIWWPLMMGLLTAQSLKIRPIARIAILASGVIVFSILQSVKQKYRQITWRGVGSEQTEGKSNIKILTDLSGSYTSSATFSLADWSNYFHLIDRLNLGVHVTNVMDYTPSKTKFAYGETILNGFLGSLLPRIFWPDKPQAGGHANYKRFAGFSFNNSSMSIGVLGEAYANFDYTGAPFYMLGYGLMLALFYKLCIRNVPKTPKLMFWIPYFFSHLIASETDFFMTFNALLKSVILFAVLVKLFPKLIKN